MQSNCSSWLVEQQVQHLSSSGCQVFMSPHPCLPTAPCLFTPCVRLTRIPASHPLTQDSLPPAPAPAAPAPPPSHFQCSVPSSLPPTPAVLLSLAPVPTHRLYPSMQCPRKPASQPLPPAPAFLALPLPLPRPPNAVPPPPSPWLMAPRQWAWIMTAPFSVCSWGTAATWPGR